MRYFRPDSSECSVLRSIAQRTYRGIDRSSNARNTTTVFCALASSDMPPSDASMSAYSSPCAGPRPACERSASSTVHAPPATSSTLSTSERSSMRSAPDTIDFCASHCQIVTPSVAASATSVSAGATSVPLRARSWPPPGPKTSPAQSTSTDPPSNAISGASPPKSMCGPFRCVAASCTALVTADLVPLRAFARFLDAVRHSRRRPPSVCTIAPSGP